MELKDLEKKYRIDDLKLEGKKVLIRVDFNVPIVEGKITSIKRIQASLKTIQKVIDDKGKAIIFSHLGRVKSEEDKINKTLKPVADELSKLLNKNVIFVPETRGEILENKIAQMNEGDVLLVENTRFEDLNDKSESKNSEELGKYWASLGDVFINDAFGTAHRSHASNVGISNNIEVAAMGYLMEKEIKALNKVLVNPQRPFVAVIGGAKISDKINIVSSLLEKADKVLIGGGMAFTFRYALGYDVGESLLDLSKVELAESLIKKYGKKLILPVDNAIGINFENQPRVENGNTNPFKINVNEMGMDIGQYTIALFSSELKKAKTILWNGPVGITELDNFKHGTEEIAKTISKIRGGYKVVGGGDSIAAVEKLGYESAFNHISTGGGASIEFLEGKTLPGIAAIHDK
ncbi:phosphoglycerate kinase [Mesomycoplasma neurolyticum]|uniref:Phosphoglycerate kinase n=1 Tax=Mesomycoplasma neurolyticum TaxID=2120 RepID=A0A449A4I0_9BACT|nr:phosphoglycerate kinase [Mesomycoplasma neurolyticum]VEU59147.1 Phosphoglycerate kinase [Mesomycoplasma neurolyticum]